MHHISDLLISNDVLIQDSNRANDYHIFALLQSQTPHFTLDFPYARDLETYSCQRCDELAGHYFPYGAAL